MVSKFDDAKPHGIESWIQERLVRVEFIGQLPIKEKDFYSICSVIQTYFLDGEKVYIKRVPTALYVTSMVFAARYSGQNVRNFWKPYSKLVWSQEKASQYFQNRCRKKFHHSIITLEKRFDLVFPQRTEGDVVRPVYRHAIIPYYLQDDFAHWLKDKWELILDIPKAELVDQLILDSSFRYLPPTLKRFISGEETKDTANNLIINISTAAELYAEDKDAEKIDLLLRENPIERDLWHELLKEYHKKRKEEKPKKASHKIDWVWNLLENEFQLRIQNIFVSGDEPPDQLVWASQDQEPHQADNVKRIIPWQQEQGWVVDKVILTPGEINGQIILLGNQGTILGAYQIPQIPEDEPVMFFRPIYNNTLGVPVKISANSIKEGNWVISKMPNIQFQSSNKGKCDLVESLPVPRLLTAIAEHKDAGFYDIEPPFKIHRDKLELASFDQQTTRSGEPKIIGSDNNQIRNISSNIPQVFIDPDISLIIPDPSNHVLNSGTLWIQSSTETIIHRLEDLREKKVVNYDEGNKKLIINLGKLIPKRIATYSVQIRIGLNPVFSGPIEFGYLPGVSFEPPESNQIYFPGNLPYCEATGFSLDNVKARSTTRLTEDDSGRIKIYWKDLRDDPELALEKDGERVLLVWEVPRFYVHLTPSRNIYSLTEFESSKITAQSTEADIKKFSLKIRDSRNKREIALNSDGTYTSEIKIDPIIDLIKEDSTTNKILDVHFGTEHWKLAEIHEGIDLKKPQIEIKEFLVDDRIERQISFSVDLEKTWTGKTQFFATPLWQPEKKVKLNETRSLREKHRFICNLNIGWYQFQINHAGEELLHPPILLFVGKDYEDLRNRVERLSAHISTNLRQSLPHKYQNDLLELLHHEYSAKRELESQSKYRLMTMPAERFVEFGKTRITSMPLYCSVISQAFLGDFAPRDDGLYPDWMILETPLIFNLIMPLKNIKTKVYPIFARNQAKSGIGYIYLKVQGRKAQVDKIFIMWDVRGKNQYDIEMGIPDKSLKKSFAELDVYDIWPLCQCKKCGEVIVTRRTKADEALHELHLHGGTKTSLIDITYDFDLIAQISPIKNETFFNKDHIRAWVDRQWAVQAIQIKDEKFEQQKPSNPISLLGYMYAIKSIIKRMSTQDKYQFWQWFSKENWLIKIKSFESIILEGEFPIPAYGPARRLLEIMQWDGGEKAVNIDKHCFLIALLLRGQAYHRGQTDQVLQQIGMSPEDLVNMLEFQEAIAPELVEWGIAFSEVMYINAMN